MKRQVLTVARLLLLLVAFLSAPAFAGYSATGNCYATLQEAASRAFYYYNASGQCASGDCRILSYVPTSGTAQVISNGQIKELVIPVCDVVNATLPSYIQPSPWYGSDPGTVSACGSTVNTSGGIGGSSGGSSTATLVGWSMTADEGAQIGVAVVGLFALAAVFKVLSKTGGSNSDE